MNGNEKNSLHPQKNKVFGDILTTTSGAPFAKKK